MLASLALRRSRTLRSALAAFFLVPFVTLGMIVAGPVGDASAVVKYSEQKPWTFERDSWAAGTDTKCSGYAWIKLDGTATSATQTVGFKGDCDTGFNMNLSNEPYTFTFSGTMAGGNGAPCSLFGPGYVDADDQETIGTDSAYPLIIAPVTPATACHISTVCLSMTDHAFPNSESYIDFGCNPISLTPNWPRGEATSTCDYWRAKAPSFKWTFVDNNNPLNDMWNLEVKWRADKLTTAVPAVYHYWVYRDPGSSVNKIMGMGNAFAREWFADGQLLFRNDNYEGIDVAEGGAPHRNIIGAGMIKMGSGNNDAWDHIQYPDQSPKGMLGVNDPSRCASYFGTKITNLTASDIDEPAGPITEGEVNEPDDPAPDPVVEPVNSPGCDFQLSDPSSWANAGMCATVGLLSALLDLFGQMLAVLGNILVALGSLAGAIFGPIVEAVQALGGALAGILGAIGDLAGSIFGWIKDALVWAYEPPGQLEWSEATEQAEGRAPFSVVTDLGEAVAGIGDGYRNSGGCGVLATFNITGDPTEVSCSEWTDTPHYQALYALTQAALVATTAFVMLGLVRGTVDRS